MLCEKCKKNEATVFYREVINGKEKKYSLCAECAAELEKSGEISLNTTYFEPMNSLNALNSIFGSLFTSDERQSRKLSASKKCNLCGASFAELVSEGRVGCPECYRCFSEELERTISSIHPNTVHNGKSPSKLREKLDVKRKIRSLESELKEAIKDERYERAAQIRDELNALRAQ